MVGQYGFKIVGDFDEKQPATSVKKLLQNPAVKIKYIGKRNGLFVFIRREIKCLIG